MNTHYPLLSTLPLQPPGRFGFLTRLLLWAGLTLLNATALVAQTPGQALNFDGVDDYVSLGTSLGNFGTGNFTIEIKLQTTFSSATSSFQDSPLLMKREDCGSGNLFGLKINPTGTLTWVMNEANGVNFVGGSTTGIACNDGAWHQVAIVRSGSSLKVYIDGTESLSLTGTVNINNGSPFLIGLDGLSCNSNRFPGSIDELRIWNVARTTTQIAEGKDCELKGNEAGLVAYFNCNQGTASGNNSGLINLTNAVSGGPTGKMVNFGLTGATSNFVAPGGAIKCVNCNTFVTRTTANGLGSNTVDDVFAVGNTVYAATAGGLSISTDGGQTFTNKVINGSVTSANVHVIGNTIYTTAGSQLSKSTDGGQTFTTLISQSGLFTSLFVQGNTIIASNLSNYGTYVLSTNGGSSFTTKQAAVVRNGKAYILGVSGADGTLYAAAGKAASSMGLHVSTDNGNTFTQNSNLSSRVNGNAVYAVNNMIYFAAQTGLFISSNGGQTFTQRTTANGLGNNQVNDVYAVGNRVYAATTNGLSISTDGGQTFTNYTTANGLAEAKINAVYVVGTTAYVATDAGLSISNFAVQTTSTRTTALGNITTTTVVPSITIAPGQSVVLTAANNTTYGWSPGGNTQSITVNTSDLYSVTATGDCSGTASVQVTVLQAGVGTTTTQTPLSAANCPVKLTATNLSGQRFLGTGPGGYVFNDAYPSTVTGKEITLTNIKQPGTYTINSINATGVTTAVNTFNVTGAGCQ